MINIFKAFFGIFIVLFVLLIFNSCHKIELDTDINNYLNIDKTFSEEAKSTLPELNETGDYLRLEYFHRRAKTVILPFKFVSDSIVLETIYDESNYQEIKDNLLNKYELVNFMTLEVEENKNKYWLDYNDYEICIVNPVQNSDLIYGVPKSFGMLAFLEKEHTIAYLYFHDSDLDGIESLGGFLDEYFSFYFSR